MLNRRFSLPMLGARPLPPSVDAVRKRFGGRAATEAGAGEIVSFETDGGARYTGVVLFTRADDLDVWVSETTVRRTRRPSLRPLAEPPSAELEALARAVLGFAALREGQRIQYAEAGSVGEGILVEKCRYGALVERADGKIFGIGFRNCWAMPEPGESS